MAYSHECRTEAERRWAPSLACWAKLLAGLSVCLGVGLAQSAEPWEAIQKGTSRGDINTWLRPVDGMAVKALRGEVETNHSALVVLAALLDVPNLAHWVYQGKASSMAPEYGANHVYMRFKGIWPTNDRDVLLKISVKQQGNRIVMESRDAEGYPVQDGFVRMAKFRLTFAMTPLADGWTRVEFENLIDLGGTVPTSLANMVSTKAPYVTLTGLCQQLDKPKYQIKSPADLPHDLVTEGKLKFTAD